MTIRAMDIETAGRAGFETFNAHHQSNVDGIYRDLDGKEIVLWRLEAVPFPQKAGEAFDEAIKMLSSNREKPEHEERVSAEIIEFKQRPIVDKPKSPDDSTPSNV